MSGKRYLTKVRMRQVEKDTASPRRLIRNSELDELQRWAEAFIALASCSRVSFVADDASGVWISFYPELFGPKTLLELVERYLIKKEE